MASADAPANDGTPRRGRSFPGRHVTDRGCSHLRLGSFRTTGPALNVVCARRPEFVSPPPPRRCGGRGRSDTRVATTSAGRCLLRFAAEVPAAPTSMEVSSLDFDHTVTPHQNRRATQPVWCGRDTNGDVIFFLAANVHQMGGRTRRPSHLEPSTTNTCWPSRALHGTRRPDGRSPKKAAFMLQKRQSRPSEANRSQPRDPESTFTQEVREILPNARRLTQELVPTVGPSRALKTKTCS